jgi:hypothetical protein
VIEDYRKCSYKDRLRILRESKTDPKFYQTRAGKRLLKSVHEKMDAEGLTVDSFAQQKKNHWKIQGKNFYQIFSEVEPPEFYKHLYGIPSESIHGSWNDSMDFNLQRNEDGTFSAYPFYQEADIRFVTPMLRLCHDPYVLWLKRINAEDKYLIKVLKWTKAVNTKLFLAFDKVYVNENG